MTDWPYPIDDRVPSPGTVAAWAQLGLLAVEKVPLWAAYWLAAGYDGEHLVHLAGLPGDDPHEVRDVLPEALQDCGVAVPCSDVAAAAVVFMQLARMYLDEGAGALWIGQKVEEVLIRSGCQEAVMPLPLGRLYGVADEWGAGWGWTDEQLAMAVRDACEEQLRNGSVAT